LTKTRADAQAEAQAATLHLPKRKPSAARLHAAFATPVPKPALAPSGDLLDIYPRKKPDNPS